jgi:hypothetical protein
MSKDWQKIVTDPEERRIFELLDDPKWDFRTMNALKKNTKMAEKKIERIISKYPGLIRESPVRDKERRRLYTLTTKKRSLGEMLNIIRTSITKST